MMVVIGSHFDCANLRQDQKLDQARLNSQCETEDAARGIARGEKEMAAAIMVNQGTFSLSAVLRQAARDNEIAASNVAAPTVGMNVVAATKTTIDSGSFFDLFGLSDEPATALGTTTVVVPVISSLSALLREAKEAPKPPPAKSKLAERNLSVLEVVGVYKEKVEATPAFASLNSVLGSITSSLFGRNYCPFPPPLQEEKKDIRGCF